MLSAPANDAQMAWHAPQVASLRDIGEASFGAPPVLAETVHGPDDRVQVTDTTSYPWRAIASLRIIARDNTAWVGTAWFISPRTLVTAGHCVCVKNSGKPGLDGWVRSITVMPGRNGSALPFGAVTSTLFRSTAGWTQSGLESYDYGAIILPSPVGDRVGVFGIGVFADEDLKAASVSVAGYPADKPEGTQWYDAAAVASVNSQKVYYDVDTVGGESGAPVFRLIGGRSVGAAVHAYGGATTNSGTRINPEVLNLMRSWQT